MAVSGTAKSSKATFALVCVLVAASACQQGLATAVVSNKISFLASRIFSRRRQDLPLAEICQYKVICTSQVLYTLEKSCSRKPFGQIKMDSFFGNNLHCWHYIFASSFGLGRLRYRYRNLILVLVADTKTSFQSYTNFYPEISNPY